MPAGGGAWPVDAGAARWRGDGRRAGVRGRGAAAAGGREARSAIAAVNGPASVVVSGDEDAVAEVASGVAGPGPQGQAVEGHSRVPFAADGADAEEFAGGAGCGLWGAADGGGLERHRRLAAPEDVRRRSTGCAMSVRPCGSPTVSAPWTRGVARFLELGPDGTLTVLAQGCPGGARRCSSGPPRTATSRASSCGPWPGEHS